MVTMSPIDDQQIQLCSASQGQRGSRNNSVLFDTRASIETEPKLGIAASVALKPKSTASLFFFWAGVLSAFSFPVAAWLAKRIGLVNTMVFTHIPSSLCLILAAFAPPLPFALPLLLVWAALSQMDVPTRSSYVMAVVTESERTAAASFTSVPRSLAASLSPAIAGALFALPWSASPLILCGALKIAYDLLLLNQFRYVKQPEAC